MQFEVNDRNVSRSEFNKLLKLEYATEEELKFAQSQLNTVMEFHSEHSSFHLFEEFDGKGNLKNENKDWAM